MAAPLRTVGQGLLQLLLPRHRAVAAGVRRVPRGLAHRAGVFPQDGAGHPAVLGPEGVGAVDLCRLPVLPAEAAVVGGGGGRVAGLTAGATASGSNGAAAGRADVHVVRHGGGGGGEGTAPGAPACRVRQTAAAARAEGRAVHRAVVEVVLVLKWWTKIESIGLNSLFMSTQVNKHSIKSMLAANCEAG